METLSLEKLESGVWTVTLRRADVHNALNGQMIEELTRVAQEAAWAADQGSLHVLVLRGAGKSFCAGADLEWMKQSATYATDENRAEAERLAYMLKALYDVSAPVVVCAHGAVYGGGLGVLAVADSVIAAPETKFCFSEVKLGLIPAIISPFVVAAIGPRWATQLFLTAEVFDVRIAEQIGLVHRVSEKESVEEACEETVTLLMKGGRDAQRRAKALLRQLNPYAIDEATLKWTAEQIATIRVGEEAQEGMRAFFEKRSPNW